MSAALRRAGIAAVAVGVSACGDASPPLRLRITIRPSTLLVDASPQITIAGLRPGETVRLTATTRRALYVWSGSATFRADAQGRVDLARQAPSDHVYDGTAPLALLGVQTPGGSVDRSLLTRPQPGCLSARSSVMESGRLAIPIRYHNGMSKQIAVRLPDELVDFVDSIVAHGEQRSRAAVVIRALERERRRAIAAHDAEILASHGPDPDLASLAGHVTGRPIDLQ